MLERLHNHIQSELHVNTRTDTIFVLAAIVFNFVMLGIGSTLAASDPELEGIVVIVIAIGGTLLVNGIAILALQFGRSTRDTLLRGLIKMYEDAGVSQYYDATLLTNYGQRYTLFSAIVGILGLMAIVIPLVLLAL